MLTHQTALYKRYGSPSVMIIVQDVVKSYDDGAVVLDHVSLHINDRDFVFLVGTSGAGKTTLIRLINKDEEPTSGSILVDGVNITRLHRI